MNYVRRPKQEYNDPKLKTIIDEKHQEYNLTRNKAQKTEIDAMKANVMNFLASEIEINQRETP